MTPKWQKSLSAMEIDYSDCCEPHSSWGDCGDRCCFSRMKISLMLVNRCWIQKPRSENESNIHQRQRRLRWRCPYRQKWLFLSQKHSFLLAFSSISHLLTLLLITVEDSAQPAATIKTWFLWTQTDFSLSAEGERERVEECRFQVVKPSVERFFTLLNLGVIWVQSETMCVIWTCQQHRAKQTLPHQQRPHRSANSLQCK